MLSTPRPHPPGFDSIFRPSVPSRFAAFRRRCRKAFGIKMLRRSHESGADGLALGFVAHGKKRGHSSLLSPSFSSSPWFFRGRPCGRRGASTAKRAAIDVVIANRGSGSAGHKGRLPRRLRSGKEKAVKNKPECPLFFPVPFSSQNSPGRRDSARRKNRSRPENS